MSQSNEQALRAELEEILLHSGSSVAQPEHVDAILDLFKAQAADRTVAVIDARRDELELIAIKCGFYKPRSHYVQYKYLPIDYLTGRMSELEQQRTALLSGGEGV